LGIYDELLIKGFERACEKYPDRTALIYIGQKFSYKRLKELIDRFATALYDLGVRDNDKVILYPRGNIRPWRLFIIRPLLS
jgi:long-chain acyl-CoA synthetase